jgi:hypothetical protein
MQIHDFALPFFNRFQNLEEWAREVGARGFLPHRKMLNRLGKKEADEFCRCFSGS